MPWMDSMLPSSTESCHLAQGQDDFHKDALSGTKPGCHFQSLRREAAGTAAWRSTLLPEHLEPLADGFWSPLGGTVHLIDNRFLLGCV